MDCRIRTELKDNEVRDGNFKTLLNFWDLVSELFTLSFLAGVVQLAVYSLDILVLLSSSCQASFRPASYSQDGLMSPIPRLLPKFSHL